jgi:hypothetical protein
MTATTFDTLGYFEKLKAAGVPEEQAKVQASAIREIVEDKLVTKAELASQLKELEYRLTIRLGSMLAAGVALLAALVVLAR